LIEEPRLHLEQANECLRDAEVLIEHRRFAAAVNRIYYAMFHAATAVLLQRGIEKNSHKGVISAFGEYLVKSGHVKTELYQYFREAFEFRQESDYQTGIAIGAEQVSELLKRGEIFVKTCWSLCQ
jgi:uncharacterized protein (UPF0332 family)